MKLWSCRLQVIFSLTLISKAHKEAQLVILKKKKITELDRRDTAQLTLNSPFLLQLYILLNVKYENLGLYYITSLPILTAFLLDNVLGVLRGS